MKPEAVCWEPPPGNRSTYSRTRGRLATAVASGTAATRDGNRTTLAWLARTSGLNGHLPAHGPRDANDLGLDDLTRHAACLRDHLRLTNLTAGRVRNLAVPDFLSHRAGRVRNLLGDRFAGPRAGRVRNFLGNGFAGP